tara:strand:+ start:797 stop:1186 length:390 start_codon:yes stop_codon:yes gene_type:complete
MEENEVKIAVLQQKIEDLKPIVLRIDTAIQKLSEVNITVSRMLAVHEERISKQEEIDTVLFAKIDKLRDKMDRDHDLVLQRIRQLEKRVWMAVGGFAVLTFFINNNGLVSKVLTPVNEPSTIQRSAIDG